MSSVGQTQGRPHQASPYQGYPYVNPPVIDVPSLNPAEVASMARWQNLPRRPARKYGEGSSQESVTTDARPHPPGPSSSKDDDDDDIPVVYIDIPENNGSDVSQTRPDDDEPDYVQETIFYDQFKDRRIEVASPSGSDDSPGSSYPSRPAPLRPSPSRPPPPSSLGFGSSGSSGPSTFSPTLPPFMSKEAYVYGRQPTQDDGFPLSPIPVSDFPAPPPPYEEVETRPPAPPAEVEPPRTQVIVSPTSPTVILDGRRKLATCPYCRATVQTILTRENGKWTHIMACILAFLFLPLVILVYYFDWCKYKHHHCPGCNRMIAKEPPSFCGSETTNTYS